MKPIVVLLVAGSMLILPGCGGQTPPADTTTSKSEAAEAPAEAEPRVLSPKERALFKQSVERGVDYLNNGEPSKAAGELIIAAALQPENAVVLRYLGNAYAHDNDLKHARRMLLASIKLMPDDPAAHYELAQVNLAAGDLDRAVEESKIAQQLDPSNRKARELVGLLQYRKGELEDAVATLELLASDSGGSSESNYTLGLCYQGLERYEEARDSFRKLLERDPEFTKAWFNLGKVLAILGDEEGAEAANEKSLRLGDRTPGTPAGESQEPADENAPPGLGDS